MSFICSNFFQSEVHQAAHNTQKPVKQEQEPVKSKNEYNNSDFINVDNQASQNIPSATKTEADDGKETMNIKNMWENSISAATSGDLNSSDQGMYIGLCRNACYLSIKRFL